VELTADAVHWQNFIEAAQTGQLEDILSEETIFDKELFFADTPWLSDSGSLYIHAAEYLLGLTEPSDEIKIIASELINENFALPNDLGIEVDPESVAGSVSPSSVEKYHAIFSQLDTSNFTEEFSGYMDQWRGLFKFARENKAGILFHLG